MTPILAGDPDIIFMRIGPDPGDQATAAILGAIDWAAGNIVPIALGFALGAAVMWLTNAFATDASRYR
jgi:hypothetical protein